MLGRLAPKKLLAVEKPVTVERVTGIFEDKIGKAAGLSGVEAAGAVLRLGNMKMAGAIRMVSVSRGHRPARFRAVRLRRRRAAACHWRWRANSACREVLVPARPGITNALGCLVADLRHDFVNTLNQPVAVLDEARASCRIGTAPKRKARS